MVPTHSARRFVNALRLALARHARSTGPRRRTRRRGAADDDRHARRARLTRIHRGGATGNATSRLTLAVTVVGILLLHALAAAAHPTRARTERNRSVPPLYASPLLDLSPADRQHRGRDVGWRRSACRSSTGAGKWRRGGVRLRRRSRSGTRWPRRGDSWSAVGDRVRRVSPGVAYLFLGAVVAAWIVLSNPSLRTSRGPTQQRAAIPALRRELVPGWRRRHLTRGQALGGVARRRTASASCALVRRAHACRGCQRSRLRCRRQRDPARFPLGSN